MTDHRLRDLERRWRESRSDADEAAWVTERLRAGLLSPGWLELAARLGYGAARLILGMPPLARSVEVSPGVEEFQRRLAETIAWCESRRQGSERERSSVLGSSFSGSLVAERGIYDPAPESEAIARWATEVVIPKRAELLAGEGWLQEVRAQDLVGGKLLLYDPDSTLADGAAEVASGGFFDSTNLPAWDTWVAFVGVPGQLAAEPFSSFLVCWIPGWLGHAVGDGVRANPEECILWANELSQRGYPGQQLLRELASLGLV